MKSLLLAFYKMKRYILVYLCMHLVFIVSAQEISGNRGEPILPEKGDWCVAFDAVPFLTYTGNVLNNNGDNSTQPEFPNGYENTLVLKKYKENNRALRLKLRLGL